MRSLVPSIAVGKAEGKLLVDLGDQEDKYGGGDIPLAILPENEEIVLLQQDGSFTREEIVEAIKMGINSCKYLHELQKDALKMAYSKKAAADDEDCEDDLEHVPGEDFPEEDE
jgi:exosome complex component RRP41